MIQRAIVFLAVFVVAFGQSRKETARTQAYFNYAAYDLQALKQAPRSPHVISISDLLVDFGKAADPLAIEKYAAYIWTAHYDAVMLGTKLRGQPEGTLDPLNRMLGKHFLGRDVGEVKTDQYSQMLAQVIFAKVKERKELNDMMSYPYKLREGAQYWWHDKPLLPEAGSWFPWRIDPPKYFTLPAPPPFGSAKDVREVEAVKQAVAKLTDQQRKLAQKWGRPPAGLWAEELSQLLKAHPLPLQDAAEVRMALGQAIYDAFVVCWHHKFTYLTHPPFDRDKEIRPLFPSPPIPSYPSANATISGAAMTVLAAYFPTERGRLSRMADESKNSRLWAGIHFPVDNKEGFRLGRRVGAEVLRRIRR